MTCTCAKMRTQHSRAPRLASEPRGGARFSIIPNRTAQPADASFSFVFASSAVCSQSDREHHMPRTAAPCRDPRQLIDDALRSRERYDGVDEEEQEPKSEPGDQTIVALSKKWRREHERATRRQVKALIADAPNPSANERVALTAAAKDLVLGETLWRSQVELASRINVLLDNPKLVLLLAKTLREVTACRNSATSRAEQLLLAVGTLRAQRRLTNPEGKPHLRRVV